MLKRHGWPINATGEQEADKPVSSPRTNPLCFASLDAPCLGHPTASPLSNSPSYTTAIAGGRMDNASACHSLHSPWPGHLAPAVVIYPRRPSVSATSLCGITAFILPFARSSQLPYRNLVVVPHATAGDGSNAGRHSPTAPLLPHTTEYCAYSQSALR